MSKFYSCEEIAKRYQIQTRTVWEWVRTKKLPAIRIGKLYRIKEEDLRIFEDSQKTIQ